MGTISIFLSHLTFISLVKCNNSLHNVTKRSTSLLETSSADDKTYGSSFPQRLNISRFPLMIAKGVFNS